MNFKRLLLGVNAIVLALCIVNTHAAMIFLDRPSFEAHLPADGVVVEDFNQADGLDFSPLEVIEFSGVVNGGLGGNALRYELASNATGSRVDWLHEDREPFTHWGMDVFLPSGGDLTLLTSFEVTPPTMAEIIVTGQGQPLFLGLIAEAGVPFDRVTLAFEVPFFEIDTMQAAFGIIPEPSTLALLLPALAIAKRRR